MTSLVLSILNESSSYWQIRRTIIKTWISLNLVKIPLPVMDLDADEHLKNLFIML